MCVSQEFVKITAIVTLNGYIGTDLIFEISRQPLGPSGPCGDRRDEYFTYFANFAGC